MSIEQEWKRVVKTEVLDIYRDGFIGVWDALVSAVTNKPRFTVAKPYTFSLWIKTDKEYDVKITGAQLSETT